MANAFATYSKVGQQRRNDGFRVMITVNRRRRLITLEISGFLDDAIIADISLRIESAITLLLADANYFDVLVIFESASPASQEGGKVMRAMLRRMAAIGLRKSALVTDSALVRLQGRRLSDRDERFGFFDDRDTADEWLTQ